MDTELNPRNTLTFSLQTPADLYRKLHFEALAIRNIPVGHLAERSYGVMNAVTTAWQMKDWVYHALETTGNLHRLHALANRRVKG